MLLTSRQLLQAKAIDIENDLRGTLRNFGLKVGTVGVPKFEARIRELVADDPDLAVVAERCWSLAERYASSLVCCIVDCWLPCVKMMSAGVS